MEVAGLRWSSPSPLVPFHVVCVGSFSLAFGRGEGARQTSGLHVYIGFLSCGICFVDLCGLFLLAWAYSGSPGFICVAPASVHFRGAPCWCPPSCSRCVMATMPFSSCSSCMLPASMLRRPRHRRGEQGLGLLSCALGFRVFADGDALAAHPARYMLQACHHNPPLVVRRVSGALRIADRTHCHSVRPRSHLQTHGMRLCSLLHFVLASLVELRLSARATSRIGTEVGLLQCLYTPCNTLLCHSLLRPTLVGEYHVPLRLPCTSVTGWGFGDLVAKLVLIRILMLGRSITTLHFHHAARCGFRQLKLPSSWIQQILKDCSTSRGECVMPPVGAFRLCVGARTRLCCNCGCQLRVPNSRALGILILREFSCRERDLDGRQWS